MLVLTPLLGGVFALYSYRDRLFPRAWDGAVRILLAAAIIAIGWQLARDVGRALRPMLTSHLEPATAGTVGFLIRLWTMLLVALVALRVAGLGEHTLAIGGAATAVLVGLAAQQTLGNVIAGMMLASAQPFRVGERVRMQGGPLAGTVEGTGQLAGAAVHRARPGRGRDHDPQLRRDERGRRAAAPAQRRRRAGAAARGTTPAEVERVLRARIQTPMRGAPRVTLEELDADEVVVRVSATPLRPGDGPILATEVLEAIGPFAAPQKRSTAAT